jgi:RHS repeat-associated protein
MSECLGLLYAVDQAEQTKTYHYDQVGSTIARTDDSGKVIGKAEYSAYGLCYWKQGDMATPFLYNGQAGVQTDPNGLLHMRARYYSPYLMRFLNADPIGFSGGSNWFAYADGNPISLSDPFGLEAQIGTIRGNMSNGGRGANPTTGQMGYIDAFGDWHQSFCMSCHDANNPAAQRNMLATIGGDTGWWIMGRDVVTMFAPLGIEALAARGAMTVANAGARVASEVGLSAGEIARIQNAANRIGKPINLVGSRASGTANAASDWDYVIEGMTNANKNAIKNSLPGAPIRADQVPRNIDFFTDPLRTDLPHIQFNPR